MKAAALCMVLCVLVCDAAGHSIVVPPINDGWMRGCVSDMFQAAGIPRAKSDRYEKHLASHYVPVTMIYKRPTETALAIGDVIPAKDRTAIIRCFSKSRNNTRLPSRRCQAFQQCSGHGKCVMRPGREAIMSYVCRCQAGYRGPNCRTKINYCSPQPCRNGGRCESMGKGFACTCCLGYSGNTCETMWLTQSIVQQLILRQDRIEKTLKTMANMTQALLNNQAVQMMSDGTVYYKLFSEPFDWETAVANCQAKGGQLASIRSHEQQFMVGTVSGMDQEVSVWLGATDKETEGHWKWLNGDPVTYQVWGPDPRAGRRGNGNDCLTFRVNGSRSHWEEYRCDRHLPFLCEFH